MKKIIIFLYIFLYSATAMAQTDITGYWDLNLYSDKYKETVFLKQNGISVFGRLKNGGSINATWVPGENRIKGYVRLIKDNNAFSKVNKYEFDVRIKNLKYNNLLVGQYCQCTEGEKTLAITLKRKQKKKNIDEPKLIEAPLPPADEEVKKIDYSGRYQVTLTRINKPNKVDTSLITLPVKIPLEVYGSIGIRMKGKGKSGSVVISSVGNKAARVWRVKSNRPATMNGDGDHIIDVMREFTITGELANKDLIVNLQINLVETNLITYKKLGWKQRNLYVKDMVLGKEYFLSSGGRTRVAFKLEKI